ncbi:MAG: hypothetical protein QM785_15545 [Pyrinomonadaceae bacterium]
MLDLATYLVITLWAAFLIILGIVTFVAPERAKAFLLAFAQTPAKHYLEMLFRLAVGASLIVQAPRTEFPPGFAVFGWMIVGTSTVLLLLPWRWHKKFGQAAVPKAVRYIGLMGMAAIAFGSVVLIALLRRT